MPPRRDFRSRKTVNVVSFKGGKAAKKSKLRVPLRYAVQQLDSPSTSTTTSAFGATGFAEEMSPLDEAVDSADSVPKTKTARFRKVKLKKKIKAYRERKVRLAASWKDVRENLLSAMVSLQSLEVDQKCVIPCCGEQAVGRCLQCSPGQFLCQEHIGTVHAGGRTLHQPEFWKDGRYVPYQFDECVWSTVHNNDHGYIRDITAIGMNGQQHAIKVKFCSHEPEAVTLVRNGFWPSTPKQPLVAFDQGLMRLLQYFFLECRVSLKTAYQAIQWLAPSLSKVYVKDVYRLLVGECFGEFRFLSSILNNLSHFNSLLGEDHECPACPKENGNMYISIDALFGCVRKCSAGTSAKAPNHGEALFIEQDKVDSFITSYNKKPTSKAPDSCNQFQAGSNLRSKIKSKKLDETALFGAGCRHEVPLKFFSLKRGEEIGNAVFLLKWIKEKLDKKNITIFFFYDIACVLDTHLKNTHQESLLDSVVLAIPAFHCYGHKVSCQVNYSGKRLEGFGLSDGEVMERLWSYLRPSSKITKEMTPAHRVDTLTDFLVHYAKKSISNIGERLCDHLKKAMETKTETADQLALLISKLAETGTKVGISNVEEWSEAEKLSITNPCNTDKPGSSAEAYPEKLRRYYSVRTNLQKSTSGSDTWKILTDQLHRLDLELKNIENGQPRWSPDSSLYLSHIRELEDKRRKGLLLSMHGKCSERWFLLQLMKKYADGQAIAKKLCGQITKTTTAVKQLVKEYQGLQTNVTGCKYPTKIVVEEALSISSPLWNVLDADTDLPSPVPYCIKRQLIDLNHLFKRCTEEVEMTKEEMVRVISYYEGKLARLENWSNELALTTESADFRGLLSITLTKLDELRIFTLHLKRLFSASGGGDSDIVDKEEGVLEDEVLEDTLDDSDVESNVDDDNGNVALELEEADVLEGLRSVLNIEYGSDDDSDLGNSDSDTEST